ncbi:porin [Neorhizobium sp. P12A]|uniref:porin n=1 Tax=Rhizobium/Agrobacterium group TaxID=227290 RepID=UPI00104D9CFB|nr:MULTISPECIES: porin [Rhizobium/Agrobacterium group]KAA0698044.1 porin [Neorhizobium sp. P12A]TCR87704.1 porin-like protein [Rhizobium sp. BK376]
MTLRRLLLSAAAYGVAASGAFAADAIVAASPEPLEYVRICDAFGKGYFFIPGTDTCLNIGGRARSEGEWKDAYNPDSRIGTFWHTRAELYFNTATDTEYGALKTNTELRWDTQGDGSVKMKLRAANISLGGFLVGKLDSQYNLYTGFAGNVINDDVVYDGPKELNQMTYRFDANGFSAVISLEDSNSSADSDSFDGAWQTGKENHYAPDVVAGAGYKSGAWSLKVVGGYDSIVEEGAIKARVDADFDDFQAFVMGGWNTDGDKMNKYAATYLDPSACPNNGADCGWGDWALWSGFSYQLTPKLQTNWQVAYTDSKIFAATADLAFRPVKALTIEPEISYTRWEDADADTWAGILRFDRKF